MEIHERKISRIMVVPAYLYRIEMLICIFYTNAKVANYGSFKFWNSGC